MFLLDGVFLVELGDLIIQIISLLFPSFFLILFFFFLQMKMKNVSPVGRFCLWGALLLVTEGSTPINNICWFLEQSGMRNSRRYKFAFHMFTLSWIVCRLLVWWIIFYQLYIHWDSFRSANAYMQGIIAANFIFLFALNHVFCKFFLLFLFFLFLFFFLFFFLFSFFFFFFFF